MNEEVDERHAPIVVEPSEEWSDVWMMPDGSVVQVKHSNPTPIELIFAEGSLNGVLANPPHDATQAPEGWRTRILPPGDDGSASIARLHLPETSPEDGAADIMATHPLAQPSDEQRVAEHAVRESIEAGWVEVMGQDVHGNDVYRLTDAGKERARELLNLPEDTEVF